MNSGCHCTPSTKLSPSQRTASMIPSGSLLASTTRPRPRSFTAWWWIELVRTTVAFGYMLASQVFSRMRVLWMILSY